MAMLSSSSVLFGNFDLKTIFFAFCILQSAAAPAEAETICFNDGTVTLGGCNCTEPWTGESCQEYKCVHGLSAGTNYDPHSTFFNRRCICDIGWTGELCDESTINKCNGHGKSIRNQCICDEFYIGEHCESVDKCINGQHWNGRCSCFYGFSGDFCDTTVCNAGKPDHETNDTTCICDSNFRGRFCDFCLHDHLTFPECSVDSIQVGSSRKKSAEVNFDPLLVGVLLCAAIIILVSFAFFFWQRKQRRSRLQEQQAIEEKDVMI